MFIQIERCPINIAAQPAEKYTRILEAAVRVFAGQGFFRTTVSQIAREAGVADGTIYLYFKNKDDILVQFFSYKTKQVFEGFKREVEQASNAIEMLGRLIRCHLREFQKDRNMAIVYQSELRQIHRVAEPQIREMYQLYSDLITRIIEQGQQEGSIRQDLYLGLVKRMVIGTVDEVISTWLHSEGRYDLVAMAQPLLDLFLSGIAIPRARQVSLAGQGGYSQQEEGV